MVTLIEDFLGPAPELEMFSPNGLASVNSCALNALVAEKASGEALMAGTVRHKALELYFTRESLSLADAALEAAACYREFPEAVRVRAIEQVRAIDSRRLPDKASVISIEGSDIPASLLGEAYGQPVLQFEARAGEAPQAWGKPYGLRMRLDLVTLEPTKIKGWDWKGADPTWDGPNDVMAMCHYLGLVKLALALDLEVETVEVVAVGIPSMLADRFEWRVDQYHEVLKLVDRYVWYRRQQEAIWREHEAWTNLDQAPPLPEARPGPKCKTCPLAGTTCPKAAEAMALILPPAETRPTLLSMMNDLEVIDLIETWEPHLEALVGAFQQAKADVLRRAKERPLLSSGFEYTAKEQATSKIDHDFDATVNFLREDLQVPQESLKKYLKIAKKSLIEDRVGELFPGRTKLAIQARAKLFERYGSCYVQGKSWQLKKKAIKDQKALPIVRDEAKQEEE